MRTAIAQKAKIGIEWGARVQARGGKHQIGAVWAVKKSRTDAKLDTCVCLGDFNEMVPGVARKRRLLERRH